MTNNNYTETNNTFKEIHHKESLGSYDVNYLPSRLIKKLIDAYGVDKANIKCIKGDYFVLVDGDFTEGGKQKLMISTSKEPAKARVFKSSSHAISEMLRLGFTKPNIKIINS